VGVFLLPKYLSRKLRKFYKIFYEVNAARGLKFSNICVSSL